MQASDKLDIFSAEFYHTESSNFLTIQNRTAPRRPFLLPGALRSRDSAGTWRSARLEKTFLKCLSVSHFVSKIPCSLFQLLHIVFISVQKGNILYYSLGVCNLFLLKVFLRDSGVLLTKKSNRIRDPPARLVVLPGAIFFILFLFLNEKKVFFVCVCVVFVCSAYRDFSRIETE